jgi:hypothetical protein
MGRAQSGATGVSASLQGLVVGAKKKDAASGDTASGKRIAREEESDAS